VYRFCLILFGCPSLFFFVLVFFCSICCSCPAPPRSVPPTPTQNTVSPPPLDLFYLVVFGVGSPLTLWMWVFEFFFLASRFSLIILLNTPFFLAFAAFFSLLLFKVLQILLYDDHRLSPTSPPPPHPLIPPIPPCLSGRLSFPHSPNPCSLVPHSFFCFTSFLIRLLLSDFFPTPLSSHRLFFSYEPPPPARALLLTPPLLPRSA